MSSSSKDDGPVTMTDAKKFLFDTNNFDNAKQETVAYTEEQMALAKTQTFAAGKAEGVQETQKQQEAKIAELMKKVLTQADKMAKNEDRREVEKSIDAVKLAARVVGKLLPGFAQQYALSEIERVISQSIEARRDEPRIAITVPTLHLETLRQSIDQLAHERGFAGKVILLSDDGMAPSDVRVEWADGGAERLFDDMWAQIDTALQRMMNGDAATPETDAGANTLSKA